MSNNGNMRRVPTFLPPETKEAIDQVADEFNLSQSRVVRDLVQKALDDEEELSDAVESAIDDDMLRIARKKRENNHLEKTNNEIDQAGGLISGEHFRNRFKNRLEGEEATELALMETLAENYKAEIEVNIGEYVIEEAYNGNWDKKQQAIERIDTYLDYYEAGLFARKHSEAIETELQSYDRNASWFDIGKSLYDLRMVGDEVERLVRKTAKGNFPDDRDACAEWIAEKWSVDKAAAIIFLQELAADDASITAMLTHGGDKITNNPALEEPEAGSGFGDDVDDGAGAGAGAGDGAGDDAGDGAGAGDGANEEDEVVERPTEPTEEMMEIAREKYKLTGSVHTTKAGLENTDDVQCTLKQAQNAAKRAAEQVGDNGSQAATDGGESQ